MSATKPSKFATEALSKIDTTVFDPDCKCASCKERFAKAAEVIDQSFATARTAFEELQNNMRLLQLKLNSIRRENHLQKLTLVRCDNLIVDSIKQAQKILKEWKGEL